MKHTALIKTDDLKNLQLPPGCTLHRHNGQQITADQISFYAQSGETIEIYQDGESVGRIRPPSAQSRTLTPENVNLMGEMIEAGQRENFKNAVNWIDYPKKRFWCPLCAKNQSKPAVVSAWVHEGRAICLFGICKRCAQQRTRLDHLGDEAGVARLIDLAERRIAERYPHIAANLSPNYFGEADEPA
jgi:hypothetical protein